MYVLQQVPLLQQWLLPQFLAHQCWTVTQDVDVLQVEYTPLVGLFTEYCLLLTFLHRSLAELVSILGSFGESSRTDEPHPDLPHQRLHQQAG